MNKLDIKSLLLTPVTSKNRDELEDKLGNVYKASEQGLDAIKRGLHVVRQSRSGEVFCPQTSAWEEEMSTPNGPDDYDPICGGCHQRYDELDFTELKI